MRTVLKREPLAKDLVNFKNTYKMKRLILFISILFISLAGFSQTITIEASLNAGYFMVNDIDYGEYQYTLSYENVTSHDSVRTFTLSNAYSGKQIISSRNYDEIVGVNSWDELTLLLGSVSALNNNDVTLQDQTTPPIFVYMNEVISSTTLTAAMSIGDNVVSLTSAAGIVPGNYIGMFNIANNRFFAANVLSVSVNDVTLDTPVDFAFQIGDIFQDGNKNMNVDGSVTPRLFSLRADPSLQLTVDVTRIIIHITDQTAMDDAKFGGLTALTNGVVLRRKDGYYFNIFNVKSNGEIGELAFDKVYDDKAPAGFYGFSSRLTFAGQNKVGVTIRLGPDDDLQVIIQDDLTGLDTFRIMVEGHIVE